MFDSISAKTHFAFQLTVISMLVYSSPILLKLCCIGEQRSYIDHALSDVKRRSLVTVIP
jgi:hypothetical protein